MSCVYKHIIINSNIFRNDKKIISYKPNGGGDGMDHGSTVGYKPPYEFGDGGMGHGSTVG